MRSARVYLELEPRATMRLPNHAMRAGAVEERPNSHERKKNTKKSKNETLYFE